LTSQKLTAERKKEKEKEKEKEPAKVLSVGEWDYGLDGILVHLAEGLNEIFEDEEAEEL